jgi:threonylcarbamoyladenosine tRNA methylthiotransferase MtaB
VKIYLDTVGCRLNQSEIERYARQFRAAGHTLVPSAEQADLVVLNTCTVTKAAASDSRQKVRQAARVGANNIVLTGCWSTLDPLGAQDLPGVSHIIPNLRKDQLVAEVLQLPVKFFDREFMERTPLPGARLRTRAFIKVQDGCDNRCTFCITTVARGPGRSRAVEEVLADIGAAVAGGVQEVVLTGVHLGSWGSDCVPTEHLANLVQAVLQGTDVPRVRLSSLEPWDLDEAFFSLWQNSRLCRHLHLPLQSGCAETLRRMARKTPPQSFASLAAAARAAIPNVAITTDIIVGFPGETETEFEESLAFVEAMHFSSGHVFTYSARPGTAAARMPGQVPHAQRKARSLQMRKLFEKSAAAYQAGFLNQDVSVLWENTFEVVPQGWKVSGLTDNYLRVTSQATQDLWNRISPVRLAAVTRDGLTGIIHQSSGTPDEHTGKPADYSTQ